MATGALDANGIWQYGEDDSETTFSGLLNKLASSTSDTVTRLESFTGYTGTLPLNRGGTGATTISGAQTNLQVGLIPMVPSSVTAVGTSATTSATGLVSMNWLTSVTLNGVFVPGYTSYRVVFKQNDASADADMLLQFTAAGIGSTGNYQNGVIVDGSTVSALNQANTNAMIVHTNTPAGGFVMDVHYPRTPFYTSYTAQSYGLKGPTGVNKSLITGGSQISATEHDGFKVTVSGGLSWSGDVAVYAYID